ncbi:MAG: UDP-N-acetylmuramate dehydrogenase [Candidatus Omnitrophica bacterium]|nr:UDP-N-acetylmuramate dehydrogenase [Candidatus Omnitrophota bacterium]
MNLTALENLNIPIARQASLSDFTTFRLGGKCPALLTCRTPEQLKDTIEFCIQGNIPFILIGSGSNLLVSDDGIDSYVIRYLSEEPLIEREGNCLIVSAGTLLDDLVQYAAECGLEGLNSMTGIPGTVGGAVVGNAGAFGNQVGDVVKMVHVFDQSGHPKELSARNLQFAYRDSIFKKTKDIIVSVRLFLKPGNKISLQKERDKILALRREKHPDLSVYPCAGSFFRNIEPTSNAEKREAAGSFLERAGAMKLRSGGAKIFEHHANIIFKSQGCRAQDVFDLSLEMARAVKAKFDLDLIREARFVGKFSGMPENVQDIIW